MTPTQPQSIQRLAVVHLTLGGIALLVFAAGGIATIACLIQSLAVEQGPSLLPEMERDRPGIFIMLVAGAALGGTLVAMLLGPGIRLRRGKPWPPVRCRVLGSVGALGLAGVLIGLLALVRPVVARVDKPVTRHFSTPQKQLMIDARTRQVIGTATTSTNQTVHDSHTPGYFPLVFALLAMGTGALLGLIQAVLVVALLPRGQHSTQQLGGTENATG